MHRSFSDILAERAGGPIPFWQKTASGLLSGSYYYLFIYSVHLLFLLLLSSGALAGVIGNPMDLSLVRMQADGTRPKELRRNYKNVFDAMFQTAKSEVNGFLSL